MDVFWVAVRESRKAALKAEHEMRLKYDKDKKQFVLIDGLAPSRLAQDGFTREETPLKIFPIDPTVARDLDVTFLASGKKGLSMLIGGVLVESDPVPFMTFYSDGTCTGFRAQMMRSGDVNTLVVDRWTCAPILDPKEAKSRP